MNQQTNNIINFRVKRDFGQVFNVAFSFIKLNFSQFLRIYAIYVLPFVFISIGLQAMLTLGLLQNSGIHSTRNYFGQMIGYYFSILIISSLSYTSLLTSVNSYIKLYYVNDGNQRSIMLQIWDYIRKNYIKVLGAFIIGNVIIFLSMFFLFLPAIYLSTALSFIFIIMIFEDKGFGEAFSKTFSYTHKSFWLTLLILIISFGMVIIISLGFTLLQFLLRQFISIHDIRTETYVYISLGISAIQAIFVMFLYIIPTTVIAFHYLSVSEEHDAIGLETRINQIGL